MTRASDVVAAALADMTAALSEYASVWRTAVERNAGGRYEAEDVLVDMQTLWGMTMRDAVRVTSAILAVWSLPGDAQPSREETDLNPRSV
jgi:hypothetical protein